MSGLGTKLRFGDESTDQRKRQLTAQHRPKCLSEPAQEQRELTANGRNRNAVEIAERIRGVIIRI